MTRPYAIRTREVALSRSQGPGGRRVALCVLASAGRAHLRRIRRLQRRAGPRPILLLGYRRF